MKSPACRQRPTPHREFQRHRDSQPTECPTNSIGNHGDPVVHRCFKSLIGARLNVHAIASMISLRSPEPPASQCFNHRKHQDRTTSDVPWLHHQPIRRTSCGSKAVAEHRRMLFQRPYNPSSQSKPLSEPTDSVIIDPGSRDEPAVRVDDAPAPVVTRLLSSRPGYPVDNGEEGGGRGRPDGHRVDRDNLNPTPVATAASYGCDNCYATLKRLMAMQQPQVTTATPRTAPASASPSTKTS